MANTIEQRFLSRIHDRRRALSGRSPMQAAMESAVPLEGLDKEGSRVADRSEVEDIVILRHEIQLINSLVHQLTWEHASWYVAEVERWAARYRGATPTSASSAEIQAGGGLAGQSPTPIRFVAGERAQLSPGDGHLALIPAGAPETVQAMVVAGNELQELPYGPSGHPDPRGATEEDCSSTLE